MFDVSGKSILNKQDKSINVTDYTLKNVALTFKRQPEFNRAARLIDWI